jgi:Rieske Fe-S protein
MSTTNPQANSPNRRSFLGLLGSVFIGLIGSVMGVASSLYAVFPIFSNKSKKNSLWHSLKSLDQIPNGISKHAITVSAQTGWANSQTEQIVWIVKENQSLDVFSAVCPHQGCAINHEANQFVCLCHMSKWAQNGAKTEGPTPRDLDKLDYRIANNSLEVNYKSFKIGVSEKIPLT